MFYRSSSNWSTNKFNQKALKIKDHTKDAPISMDQVYTSAFNRDILKISSMELVQYLFQSGPMVSRKTVELSELKGVSKKASECFILII